MPSLGLGLSLGSSNPKFGVNLNSISNLKGWWSADNSYDAIRYGYTSGTSTSWLSPVSSSPNLGTGSISVCSWAKKTNVNNQLGLVSRGDAGSVTGAFTLDSPGNYCRFMVSDGTGGGGQNAYANTTALPASTLENWFFNVGVWNNTSKTATLFVNNAQIATFTNANCTISATAGNFRLFNVTGSAGTGSSGNQLAGTGGWSRVLTSAEQTWLYNSGKGRTYNELGVSGNDGSNLLTNLQFWYDLDESSGNALDSSGNGHHLSRSGTINTSSPTLFAPTNNSGVKGLLNLSSQTSGAFNTTNNKPSNLECGIPADKPLYVNVGINNRPTISFVSEDILSSLSGEWRKNTSLFFVGKYTNSTSQNYDTWISFFTNGDLTTTGMVTITQGGTNNTQAIGVSQPSNDRILSTNGNGLNPFILHFKTDNLNAPNITLTQYRPGNNSLVLTGTASTLTGTMSHLSVGRLYQLSGQFGIEGYVSEIALFNPGVSSDEEAKIISYFRNKYAI